MSKGDGVTISNSERYLAYLVRDAGEVLGAARALVAKDRDFSLAVSRGHAPPDSIRGKLTLIEALTAVLIVTVRDGLSALERGE